ncbi:MAG: TerB family tellurite resistance protein [Nannocystaceae bacterium]|nr:TerB family tellurite resistance protein [Nannocystaceae bacterium]
MTMVDDADSGTFDAVLMLYIACAKLPDGALDEREAARILDLGRAHTKGLAHGYAEQAVEDGKVLGQAEGPAAQLQLVVDAAQRASRNLDDDAKESLVAELRSIARADGENTSAELDFVHAVAKTLGVE